MAFINEYTVNVDIKRRMSSIVPTFKQGESARLKFKVFDDGEIFDLTSYTKSEITFRLPSGTTLLGFPYLENGLIVYDFSEAEMAEVGNVETSIDIYSGVTNVSVQPFKVFIYESMKKDNLSYIEVLQDLIAEVQLLNTEVEKVVADVEVKVALLDDAVAKETERQDNEDERILNEGTRTLNEQNRELEESTRVASENTRESNEIARVSAENLRKSNETTRQGNETARQTNETSRQDNESLRVSAETTRSTNETSRENAESIRVTNETTRESNESTRELNETDRINAENQRIVDENTRNTNESTRQSNEVTRQTNETNRQSTFNTKIQEINNVLPNVQGLENVESWNGSTQYYKNNIVEYNGSSFMALQDNIGKLPPTLPTKQNPHWSLVAQRGIDGTGSVVSVNGISPDVNGNVSLDLGGDVATINNVSPDINGNVSIDYSNVGAAPTIHSHGISEVTGLQDALDNKASGTDLSTTNTTLSTHTSDTNIHVTTTDKSNWNAKYNKPANGIPKTDLSTAVQTSLGKADTALQSVSDASTTAKGIVQLNDTLTSISTTQAVTANQAKVLKDLVDGKYSKPVDGIPIADLGSSVQTSLGKADSALQSIPTASPTVLGGVKTGTNITNSSGTISIADASTTQKGVVQLNDTLTSTSTTEASTANQAKVLSDKINVLTQNLDTTNSRQSYIEVNVVDYGADPSGVLDSTQAIQNAINTGNARKVVYFPEGTYKISSTILIYSNLMLQGAGIDRTIIKWDVNNLGKLAMFERDFVTVDTGVHYVFKNMTIDGSFTERNIENYQGGYLINASTLKYVLVENVKFKNCMGSAVAGASTQRIIIRDCLFEDIGEHVIYFSNSSKDILIEGNEIRSVASIGAKRTFGSCIIKLRADNTVIENVRIANNRMCAPEKGYLETNPYYAVFLDGTTKHKNIVIEDNTFNYLNEQKAYRGVYAASSTSLESVIVDGNQFYGARLFAHNNDTAIQFFSTGDIATVISNNFITGFNKPISQVENAIISKNIIRNSGFSGILNSTLIDNDIEANSSLYGVYATNSNVINNRIKKLTSIANGVALFIDATTNKLITGNVLEDSVFGIDGGNKVITNNVIKDNVFSNITTQYTRINLANNIVDPSKMASQADSVATDINGLKTDFNNLLSKLRSSGLMS